MASRYHGVSADTYKRMILDAGEIRVNFVSLESPGLRLGATRGGSEFAIEPDMREMEVDGAPGPVMGGARMTSCTAKLICNFVEINEDILKLAMPGATVHDAALIGANLKQLKRAMKLWAEEGSYLDPYSDNVVLFAEVAGTNTPIICGVLNALATGNFELSLEDKSEAVVKVEFTAHFDPVKLAAGDSTEPWILLYPDTFEIATTTAAATTTGGATTTPEATTTVG